MCYHMPQVGIYPSRKIELSLCHEVTPESRELNNLIVAKACTLATQAWDSYKE